MPGGRDRQELGQPLDHAHHGGFQQQHQIHKRSSKNLGGLSLLDHPPHSGMEITVSTCVTVLFKESLLEQACN
jgi:hypothetical protein